MLCLDGWRRQLQNGLPLKRRPHGLQQRPGSLCKRFVFFSCVHIKSNARSWCRRKSRFCLRKGEALISSCTLDVICVICVYPRVSLIGFCTQLDRFGSPCFLLRDSFVQFFEGFAFKPRFEISCPSDFTPTWPVGGFKPNLFFSKF